MISDDWKYWHFFATAHANCLLVLCILIDSSILALCIWEIPKRILLQQWRPRWNAACCCISSGSTLFVNVKKIFRQKHLKLYYLTPLDMYNWLSQIYCIKPEGRIHLTHMEGSSRTAYGMGCLSVCLSVCCPSIFSFSYIRYLLNWAETLCEAFRAT